MLLGLINKLYFIVAIIIYVFLAFKSTQTYTLLNFYVIVNLLSYMIVIYFNSNLEDKEYNGAYLAIEVFIYSLFFVILLNALSYYYSGDFFVFSASDAITYHNFAIKMVSMPFSKAIDYYLSIMESDDLGMVMLLYPLYLIYKSNLMLNFFYILVAILSSLSLFSLGQNFLSRKYAFLASLFYSISSFSIFFYSSGLKETFMIMLLIFSFDFIYKFIKSKNIIHLFIVILSLFLISFFRPALIGLFILSFAISFLISKKEGLIYKIFTFLLIFFLLILTPIILKIANNYMAGGYDALIYAREADGAIKGGLAFTYLIHTISQTLGPLPTMLSSTKIVNMLFAPSLIYKFLLSMPFWLSIFFIFKLKYQKAYAVSIFILLEMFSLIFLIDGIELRKSMPHIPFFFLIAFWFLDKFDNKQLDFKKPEFFNKLFILGTILLMIIMLYWNFR